MWIISFSLSSTLVLLLFCPYSRKWTNIQGRPLASPPLASSCFHEHAGMFGKAAAREAVPGRRRVSDEARHCHYFHAWGWVNYKDLTSNMEPVRGSAALTTHN